MRFKLTERGLDVYDDLYKKSLFHFTLMEAESLNKLLNESLRNTIENSTEYKKEKIKEQIRTLEWQLIELDNG